jgi:periodic tryptophan protein 1
MLPNFPLCLEWLDFPPAGSPSTSSTSPKKEFGNYIAVGTMDPEIEIWSLDVLEGMYPDMVLGRPDKTTAHVPVPLGTGKKKKKKPNTVPPLRTTTSTQSSVSRGIKPTGTSSLLPVRTGR